MHAKLHHINKESSTISTFWFKPERTVEYVAGQYIELTLEHEHPDNRGVKRWFTLSSPPGHELVSITTRYAGAGSSSSFKTALFDLQPGDELGMSQPMGDFVLPKDPDIPLVFIAGGIGLTPYHSIFEWLAEHEERRTIRFLYSVRTESEIIFQDTFAHAGIHATIFVEEPSDAWGGERGRLSVAQTLALAAPSADTLLYISGPEPMMEAFEKGLLAAGVPKRQLVTDFFPGYLSI